MKQALMALYQRGELRAIDVQFACLMGEEENQLDKAAITVWAALLSREVGKGHVCLDLNQWQPPTDVAWQPLLAHIDSQAPSKQLAQASVVSDGTQATPLVLAEHRLYLHRYWHAEQQVAEHIRQRLAALPVPDEASQTLDNLFAASQVEIDWQKVAAATALTQPFAVISGGPGTGKTTTVARLLAALVASHHAERTTSAALTIKLVAPTGKAANRLTESLGRAIAALPVDDDVKAALPTQASTIHRLLGAIPQRVAFRHHKNNPVHADVLIVDEASMVDLPLMAQLFDALAPSTRIILLGDKDQLASVEAGAVLGDICQYAEAGYPAAQAARLSQLTGFDVPENPHAPAIASALCLLRKSYRFDAQSGIGQLAFAVNRGEMAEVGAVLKRGYGDIAHHVLSDDSYQTLMLQAVAGYRDYLTALDHSTLENQRPMADVLSAFSQFRLLCALTEGPFGVAGLNQAIEQHLASAGLIAKERDTWYHGRPIMIMQNDHALGLYNGDIGIAVQQAGITRVAFETHDGEVRYLLASRLPAHQTAFAMTVHKSQGSEFAHTVLVCPPTISPVITRELIYTGITRAKHQLDLYASWPVLRHGVGARTARYSGLPDALLAPL